MSEPQARFARDDVYDHEHDAGEAASEAMTSAPREAGSAQREAGRSARRRRPVADWGVGDDVFDHMPRNRFSRASEGPPRERRFASREAAEHRADGEPRRRAPQAGVPRGGVEDGRRTIVIGKPEDVPSEIAAVTADRDLGDVEAPVAPEPPASSPEPTRDAPTAERRTVRIDGRPEGSLEASRAYRASAGRRPPRTAHERIGARPERLAMWAVALGILLIVLALLTGT